MSLNIIDLIKGQLGPALISQVSNQLGESESGISKAITALLPSVVGGLANNADKPGLVDSILGASSGDLLGNLLGGSSNNSMITSLLSSVFGDKLGGIVSAVSSFSGVSSASSSSLLNIVTGATVGSLGKYASENNLGASGLTSLLSDQKGILSSLVPAGFSLGSLGLGNLLGGAKDVVSNVADGVTDAASNLAGNVTNTASNVADGVSDAAKNVTGAVGSAFSGSDNNNGGGSIWKWLLPLVLLLAAGWFVWKQCEDKKVDSTLVNATDSTAIKSDSASTTTAMDSSSVKVDTDIDLNGTMLKGYKGGLEDQMITFLKNGSYKNAVDDAALKTNWYNFDHVNFKIGSSTELEAGSQGQIDNLVAILKAFPEAKINVGGYTDKSGDEAKNVTLSQARADFIKAALTKAGVGSQVIEAKGYGSEMATLPATASVEERAVDRKMAVRFTK